MPGSQLNVHLSRDSFNTPWGFRLQGGKDLNQPLVVQRVFSNSPAEGELQRGDVILAIGGQATNQLSHKLAQDAIIKAGGQINLVVNRPPPGCVHISPLSPPIVTQRPRAPSLQDDTQQEEEAQKETKLPRTLATDEKWLQDLKNRFLVGLKEECTPLAADYVKRRLDRLRAVVARDLSHSSPSPRRPAYPQHTPPSNNYNQHNSQDNYNNRSMSARRQHNQPIHVHIEPHMPHTPTAQTTYYFHTPSPQPHQSGYNPYATLPRRQRGYSQPPFQSPTTPTIPPPPWATQQSAPKKVSKLSHLGGGGTPFGTSYKSSTLPRTHGSHPSAAQYQARRRQPDQNQEEEEPDFFQEKRPTGPPPKVCSLANLGGGSINLTSGGESQTLPRRTITRRLSQPPSMPSRSNYGYQQPKGAQYNTSAQRFEPVTQNGAMLNRVQSTLDNINLSPRTPDASHGGPFFQPQQQQQPPKQSPQFYTPTSLLLEQQEKMEQERQRQQQQQQPQYQPQPQYQQPTPMQQPQQHYGGQDEVEEEEGEEPIVPVWERRKQFQEKPASSNTKVRSPRGKPVPKVQRPAPGSNSYNDFGLSYRPQNQQSTAVWQPQEPGPANAPPPQKIHYSSSPSGPKTPMKSTPPAWQRPQDSDDETDGVPAWRNTLRSSGVKPWDVDLSYQQEAMQDQEHQRSVPYNPTPYQTMHSPKASGADATDGGGPSVVHLQYNSPIGLYSNDNVEESFKGQTNAMAGQQGMPSQSQQGQGLPGGRDWSQSQVFQFLQQGPKKGKGKHGPATAPKPHAALQQVAQQPQQQQRHQPQQQHQPQPPPQQHYHVDDVGISDF